MTYHTCLLPSFGSFGPVVSEEKMFRNRPIRNKNCLWRHVCKRIGPKWAVFIEDLS